MHVHVNMDNKKFYYAFCRWDVSADLDKYNNPEKLGRTIEEIKTIVSSSKKPNYGCVNAPLIDIPLGHVIPDELHLLLRITDILIQNLILAASSHDLNVSKIPQSKVRNTNNYILNFLLYMHNIIKSS